MSTDLRTQLQTSLGSAYTLERELGGGGMSRTYVAQETSLNRRVVVKVLSPDLAAGVSVERFKREIQLAAALQHPHIVPVLSAGDTNGLPFYTMPFVAGESLRARLVQGPLGISEAVSILKDVARALAFAHQQGVVHRDIKPDNVLLSGGSATVADFGIAKAISAARADLPGATITQLGTALGTPSYMAPEQAAGDPGIDHRADLYAFGVMGYEMLAGRPPFHGLTPQRLLAAHMGERPRPVAELRADVPAGLADLVMRCLEKDANLRPQSAGDVARFLDTVTSGGGQTAAPAVLLGGRGMFAKALLLYAAAFVVVAVLAKAAIVGIGLPDWVFPGALIVMGLGLPVILATAYVHRVTHRVLVATPSLTPGGGAAPQGTMASMALKAAPHMSWRRTAVGGVAAVGAFITLIAAWMIMRALGIGPAASLMAAGKLGQKERIILTDFKGPASDSLLGPTVTEAFRTDLGQSTSLVVMPRNAVREVLTRMQRPAEATVDFTLAREIATREGIKAVVDGDIVTLGGSYVLSARLVSAQDGEQLATFRETAAEAKDIIPAISRLSKQLRSKVGESLRTVQNARTLDRVTTPSLAALQKYVSAVRVLESGGDWDKGRALLEESIALDTSFAMAYRKLAVEMSNRGLSPARIQQIIQKAYDHRDRLSETERYLTVAGYYSYGPKPDLARVISAYESLLELDPDNVTALNNLTVRLRYRRDFAKGEELTRRAIALQPTTGVFFSNLAWSQMAQGKLEAAESTSRAFATALPRSPTQVTLRTSLAVARGQYDSAIAIQDSLRRARAGDVVTRGLAESYLSALSIVRGRLAEGARWRQQFTQSRLELGNTAEPLNSAIAESVEEAWFRGTNKRALERLERGLAEHPLDSIPAIDRPYGGLVYAFSLVGRSDRAKAMLAAFDRRRAETALIDDDITRHAMLGHIALADQQYESAAGEFRASDATNPCLACALPDLARAYDLAGNADSAIAVYSRFVGVQEPWYVFSAQTTLAPTHKRLAELYDAKGAREQAMSHYSAFIELWKDADAELQPQVKRARERLQELQRGRGD